MEKLELRARARAAARAAALLDIAQRPRNEGRAEARARSSPDRRPRPTPPPAIPIQEEQARAACAPMGDLEYVVQSADVTGRVRTLYVIIPDMAMKPQYERLGFAIEPGCRMLLDAASLAPIAVLRLSACCSALPQEGPAPAGFNPYFDAAVL